MFTDHMEVCTWKAWCPSFLALSKVPGILVIGKSTILGVGFLRGIYGTVRVMTALLHLSNHGAKREEVSFFVSELQCDTQQATRPKGFETIGNHGFPGNMVVKHVNLLDRKCLDGESI